MVEDLQTEEDFRNEMAAQAREQRDAIAAMDNFDNRLKKNRMVGDDDDSSSEEEASGPRRNYTELDVEKQKNQILMDKLFRA